MDVLFITGSGSSESKKSIGRGSSMNNNEPEEMIGTNFSKEIIKSPL